tara:strand:+ start:2048 stop:2857 length:810 start_codon:yes stop_codon:yes gene_type:complete
MPELPEVETTVRAINKFENHILNKVIVHNKNLRWKVEKKVQTLTKKQLVRKITRRAKYILMHLDSQCLMIHLGMSGKLRIQNVKDNYFKKHDHAELIFENEKIVFNDVRRFGSIHLCEDPEKHKLIKDLGVEPLSKSFNKAYLLDVCRNSNLCIKKLIMDQKNVVGVGNIYASESLFLAKINPNRLSKDISASEGQELVKSIKIILKRAIKMGGTTLQDFYSADGNQGYFSLKLNVYGRNSMICNNCDSKIVKSIIGQRATYSCDNCQL